LIKCQIDFLSDFSCIKERQGKWLCTILQQ
jgi:hypothetical protein